MNKNKPVIAATILLAAFLAVSIWLIVKYVESERERDMFKWEDRLSILAESHKRTIEEWLEDQIKHLDELAENPLTQIYLTMPADSAEGQTESERGQIAHLRNLLIAAMKRSELFAAPQQISSNLVDSTKDGMAILDAGSGLRLSTRNFPTQDNHLHKAVELAQQNRQAAVYGIYRNEDREPRLIIAVPVKRVQAVTGSEDFAGFVVAVINPALSLYKLFAQEWLTTVTDEALLVSGDDNSTVYLSPLREGYQLFHRAALSSERLASNFARMKTGGFDRKTDYRGVDVLVTGRAIDKTNWTIAQKIDASEALRESRTHQNFVLTVFLLAIFVVAAGFVAIWRHSSTMRLHRITQRLEARTALLNSVGDNIRDHIFLLGNDENIIFINKTLADCIGVHYEDIVGKSLHHIFGLETTECLLSLKGSSEQGGVKNRIMQLLIGDEAHDYHVSLVALTQGDYKNSLLYVLHDITELKATQDRHNRLLEGIIATLVYATDMHDPHCAHHSERTREVAVAIAQAMGLSEERTRVLSMAALLANIGKLYLPREILTKLAPLTEEEEQMLQQHVAYSVDILKGLEFDGPVIKIIEQKNERPDGKGYPEGLTAGDIMQEAKIISVANAFVAMSSARAYRPGKPVNEVIDAMLEQADEAFDRNVIAALFHIAENRSDWKNWQTVQVS
jgi:HD-GYP domain-containing protein (c-di-GMP phosphodiesterase class II)